MRWKRRGENTLFDNEKRQINVKTSFKKDNLKCKDECYLISIISIIIGNIVYPIQFVQLIPKISGKLFKLI